MSFLSSKCVRPSYLQDKSDDAAYCGLTKGLSYAIAIILIIIVFTMENNSIKNNFKMIIGLCIFILCILPIYFYYNEKNKWIGYNKIKKDLEKQGLSKFEIIQFINSLDNRSSLPLLGGIPIIGTMFRQKEENKEEKKEQKKEEKKEEKKDDKAN